MAGIELPVVHTNVFGSTPKGGNPCPVVFNADHLTTDQMQSLAANFGSETAFVLKTSDTKANIRLRFFVPQNEMEMCVHAIVGTITIMLHQGRLMHSSVFVETPLGVINSQWRVLDDGRFEVLVDQFRPIFSEANPDKVEVAQALHIPAAAIDETIGPIQTVSTSRSKLIIPLLDWSVLYGLKPDFEHLWTICDRYNTTGFYPFTVQTRDTTVHVEARQFPKRVGYNEDPATGVAACALGAYLVRYAVFSGPEDGEHSFRVGQGHAMRRPSTIYTSCYVEGGNITRTHVGGIAELLSESNLTIQTVS